MGSKKATAREKTPAKKKAPAEGKAPATKKKAAAKKAPATKKAAAPKKAPKQPTGTSPCVAMLRAAGFDAAADWVEHIEIGRAQAYWVVHPDAMSAEADEMEDLQTAIPLELVGHAYLDEAAARADARQRGRDWEVHAVRLHGGAQT